MEEILKYTLLIALSILIVSCELNSPGSIFYNNDAGNELMSYKNPNNIIEKPAVYLFQLESVNDDSTFYYDSDVKGTDITKIKYLERFKYNFKIGNVDSIQVQLFDGNNNQIFNLDKPNSAISYTVNSGTYTLKVTNLKQDKGVRNIFYKPNYDTIRTFRIYNSNNEAIYSIITEDECTDCNLASANMRGFKLDSINFTNADFQNSNLQGADLSHSVLNYVNFLSVKADSANMSYSLFDKPKDLRHTTFNFVNAKGISIRGAHLDFAKFFDCDLSYSIFNDCYVENADFFACNFKNSDLRNNNFANASFEYSRFDSSDITGTDFCNSYLKNATFYKTIGDETTKCVPDSARGTRQ